jgi:hypothetical protein
MGRRERIRNLSQYFGNRNLSSSYFIFAPVFLRNFYRILNILSIDVALGAMCGALFFSKLLHVNILVYGILCLGLTVWIIYTVDHLLDAKRIGKRASTQRHRFHQQHFNLLWKMVLLALLVNVVLIFFIRERVLIGGIFLSGGVVVYLLINRYLKILKEFMISVLYTCGILMPSIVVTSFSVQEIPWVLMIQFALTALLNLLVFSWFDYENDLRDRSISFATMVGKERTCVFIVILILLISMVFIYSRTLESSFILCIGIGHVFLLLKHQYFRENERFRSIGDALFIVPICYYFL